jgi:hypothetical protein
MTKQYICWNRYTRLTAAPYRLKSSYGLPLDHWIAPEQIEEVNEGPMFIASKPLLGFPT